MDMSVTEILKELPKLSPTDRAAVWKKLGEITEADVPATFRQGMRDIAKGLTVDRESALREEPPGAAR
jgi:ribosomal protein L29